MASDCRSPPLLQTLWLLCVPMSVLSSSYEDESHLTILVFLVIWLRLQAQAALRRLHHLMYCCSLGNLQYWPRVSFQAPSLTELLLIENQLHPETLSRTKSKSPTEHFHPFRKLILQEKHLVWQSYRTFLLKLLYPLMDEVFKICLSCTWEMAQIS